MKRSCEEEEEEEEETTTTSGGRGGAWTLPKELLRTYVLFGAMGLDHSHLRERLGRDAWRELDASAASAAEFVWAEMEASFRFDPRSYGVRCVLKNMLAAEGKACATDKGRLHAALQLRFPAEAARHVAKTRLLRDVAALSSSGEVLIVRPIGHAGWGGRGVAVVATDAELQAVRSELLPKCPNAIASEYVVAPLLWQGRKMHLRMYWLVCAQGPGTEFRTLLWERGKILTAAKPYTQENFSDKAIHDTHAKSTPRNLFFPEDIAQELDASAVESILAQMRKILGCVAELLRDNARPYNESLLAYEVFGCDFLVAAADHRVVLMEINDKVGFQQVPGDTDADGRYAAFTREYYAWVYENAIGPMTAAWRALTPKFAAGQEAGRQVPTTTKTTTIVSLESANEMEVEGLVRVSADPAVMRSVGDTQPWTKERVRELAEWAKKDKATPPGRRGYWSWIILAGANRETAPVVGFVGLRPTRDPHFPGLQLRFFVAKEHQRRGHAQSAVSAALREYSAALGRRETVWAFVRPDNAASAALLTARLGFVESGHKAIGRELERVFKGYASAEGDKFAPPRETPSSSVRDAATGDDFPYRRKYMPPFSEMFSRLRGIAENVPAEWSVPHEQSALGVVERTFPADYEETDSLSDHFSEPERIKNREKGRPSPLEAWRMVKRELRFGKIATIGKEGPRELREAVYARSRGCNLFNTALAVALISRFCGGRGGAVLDCTAGWGDRLVAVHAAGTAFYRGWDTNPALQSIYSSLAAACTSAGATPVDWHIECAPFESASHLFSVDGALHKRFDGALVCPPYFDQELYNGPATSSTVHNTYKRWIENFYKPMLRQARDALKPGGHLLGYVRPGDLESEAKQELSDMEYLGSLGFRQVVDNPRAAKKPAGAIRGTFVWRKR